MKFAIPLALGIVLLGAFVWLLSYQANRYGSAPAEEPKIENVRPPPEEPQVASEAALRDTVDPYRIPVGSPTDPDPYAPRERPRPTGDGEFFRWNIAAPPEGWDPEVARALHEFFERMEFDSSSDRDKLEEVVRTREEIEAYLESLGPEALPTMAAILNAEPDFVARRFLLRAIGNLGPESEEATFVLRDFFLARQADTAARSEAYKTIEAMGSLKNESSFQVMKELIGDHQLGSYRHKLIESLGEHPRREDAIDVFSDAMVNDRTFHTRNKAAQALGKVRSSEALSDLYHAYRREPVWYARQTILGSIGKTGNPNSIPFLEGEARTAGESGIRLSAAGALRRIGTPYALQILRELCRTEPDPEVQKHICEWASGEE